MIQIGESPIYCFKFENGTWKRYVIEDYHISGKFYIFSEPRIGSATRYFILEDKFERFVNCKFFTKEDNLERAKKIALDTLDMQVEEIEYRLSNTKILRDSILREGNGDI